MNSLLNKEDIVVDFLTCNEFSLVRGDEVRDDRFKPKGNNFGEDFVRGITEGDGAETVMRTYPPLCAKAPALYQFDRKEEFMENTKAN